MSGALRQSQSGNATQYGCDQVANFIARCAAKLIGECTQQALGADKAQHQRIIGDRPQLFYD